MRLKLELFCLFNFASATTEQEKSSSLNNALGMDGVMASILTKYVRLEHSSPGPGKNFYFEILLR